MKRRKGKGKEGRKGKTKYISMKRTDGCKGKTVCTNQLQTIFNGG
jgi:hypothetical protein